FRNREHDPGWCHPSSYSRFLFLDSSALEWRDAGEPVCLCRVARRECGFCAIGNRFALVPIETDSRISARYTFFAGRPSHQFEEKIWYRYVAEKMSSFSATDGKETSHRDSLLHPRKERSEVLALLKHTREVRTRLLP